MVFQAHRLVEAVKRVTCTSRMLAFTGLVVACLLVANTVEAAPGSLTPLKDQLRSFDNIIASLIGMEERLVRVGQSFARSIFVPLASISLLLVLYQTMMRGGELNGFIEQVFWTGVFALLIEIGPELGKTVVVSFREVAQSVASEPVMPQALFNKSLRLANEGFSKSWYRPDMWMITFVLGLLSVSLAGLISAVIFVWESEARVVLAASTVMLGLGGAAQTRNYAQNFFRYAMGAGLRLMVVELINAQTMNVLDAGIDATLQEESSTLEIWYTLIGGYLCTLVLVVVCPIAISAVASGSISSGAGLIAKAIPLSVGVGALGKMIGGAAGAAGAAKAVGASASQGQTGMSSPFGSAARHEEQGAPQKRSDEGGPVPAARTAQGGAHAVEATGPGGAPAQRTGMGAVASRKVEGARAPVSGTGAAKSASRPSAQAPKPNRQQERAAGALNEDEQSVSGGRVAQAGLANADANVAQMPATDDPFETHGERASSFAHGEESEAVGGAGAPSAAAAAHADEAMMPGGGIEREAGSVAASASNGSGAASDGLGEVNAVGVSMSQGADVSSEAVTGGSRGRVSHAGDVACAADVARAADVGDDENGPVVTDAKTHASEQVMITRNSEARGSEEAFDSEQRFETADESSGDAPRRRESQPKPSRKRSAGRAREVAMVEDDSDVTVDQKRDG